MTIALRAGSKSSVSFTSSEEQFGFPVAVLHGTSRIRMPLGFSITPSSPKKSRRKRKSCRGLPRFPRVRVCRRLMRRGCTDGPRLALFQLCELRPCLTKFAHPNSRCCMVSWLENWKPICASSNRPGMMCHGSWKRSFARFWTVGFFAGACYGCIAEGAGWTGWWGSVAKKRGWCPSCGGRRMAQTAKVSVCPNSCPKGKAPFGPPAPTRRSRRPLPALEFSRQPKNNSPKPENITDFMRQRLACKASDTSPPSLKSPTLRYARRKLFVAR